MNSMNSDTPSHPSDAAPSDAASSDTNAFSADDLLRLQAVIVDALEDVKARQIMVFDTTSLSPLFERVIIASGTSSRQTRGLASSVRESVTEAGFPKPRAEGEDNGEWVIVDCGAAVVHIMHPAIRQYYNLEELWGEHPIDLPATGRDGKSGRNSRGGRGGGKSDSRKP